MSDRTSASSWTSTTSSGSCRRRSLRSQAPKNDPLAELARIVGQDDPFQSLIAGEKQARRPAPTGLDALFVDPEP